MNLDLKNVSHWLKANKLSLNVATIELIIFHSSSKMADHNLKFKLDEKKLIQTDKVKYLDVLLDNHLLWLKQINNVATTLNQAIGILNKLRSRAFLKILKMAYYSFSVPTYCMGLNFGANQL